MSADAVALFRPKDFEKLKPFLDLDDETEESDGLYAELLEDGSVLVHTFQPFEVFDQNPAEAREWLEQFGDVLPHIHDDIRGLFFFPDTCEPEGTTYESVLNEVADEGVWLPLDDEAGLAGLPPIDMETLQAFAGQLLGDAEGRPASSFEVAKLFENVQQQLLDNLGIPDALSELRGPAGAAERHENGAKSDVIDDEFAGDGDESVESAPPSKPHLK